MNDADKILLKQWEIATVVENTDWIVDERIPDGKATLQSLGSSIKSLHTFYITEPITNLIHRSYPTEIHESLTCEELPFQQGLLILENSNDNDAYVWCTCLEQPHWVFYRHRNGKPQCGEIAPDDPFCIEADSLVRFMLSKKAATFRTVPEGDGTYKTQIRLNQTGPDRKGPHIVTLRSVAQEYRRTETYKEVDWKSRWWVRGHFRRLSSGKITTVKPYVKGPTYRPLTTTIYEVVR